MNASPSASVEPPMREPEAPSVADDHKDLLDLCEEIGHPCEGGRGAPPLVKVGGVWRHCSQLADHKVVGAGQAVAVCAAHVAEAVSVLRRDGSAFPFPYIEEYMQPTHVVEHWSDVVERARVASVKARATLDRLPPEMRRGVERVLAVLDGIAVCSVTTFPVSVYALSKSECVCKMALAPASDDELYATLADVMRAYRYVQNDIGRVYDQGDGGAARTLEGAMAALTVAWVAAAVQSDDASPSACPVQFAGVEFDEAVAEAVAKLTAR